jgi:hypothetical protein
MSWPSRLLAAPLALLALAGCTSTLNTGELEGATRQQFKTSVGVEVAAVDCPDDVDAKAGATFTCTVTGKDGSSASFQVTQTDDEGHVKFGDRFVKTARLEQALTKEIGAGGTVECPDVVVLEKGATFDCAATKSGQDATVGVTINDTAGADVSYKVKPSS